MPGDGVWLINVVEGIIINRCPVQGGRVPVSALQQEGAWASEGGGVEREAAAQFHLPAPPPPPAG